MFTKYSRFIIVLISFSLVLSQTLFAQNNQKVTPPTEVYYSNSSSTNDVQSLTKEQPKQVEFSAQKQDLLKQLEDARSTNNTAKKERVENLLNQLDGHTQVTLVEDPNIHGGAVVHNSGTPEDNFTTGLIVSGGIWSSATQTTPSTFPAPGVIWVASNIYAAGGDTCKIYSSTNGGQTFTYSYYYFFGGNMDFKPNELDIELVYDGTTTWIYGVAGYADLVANRTYSILFRFNTTTSAFNGYVLNWPGSATTTNLYYNPRLTSDNSNYTSATYLYLSCSFDSTAGATHVNRQKYAHITNPFAVTPTIDYAQTSVNNGGFYWNTSGLAAGTYLWTDIAYFRTSTSGNRIITLYNVPGSANYGLYLAWSDDFGVTVTGNSSIAETNVDYGARMVFNGGTGIYSGMIAYVRQFSGTDWDPYYRSTTDGGTTWTAGYIDGSSNRARTVDIVAPRSTNNSFKVAYVQDSATSNYAFYTGGNATGFTSPSHLTVSPAGADSVYTKAIAGFKNGGGDDCFLLYSMGSGTNVYGSRLCQSLVGIQNNSEIPKVYSLSQNYPNPFNPTTSIKFSLPKAGIVKLAVYDILGNEVMTLQNGTMQAGNYILDFNTSNLSSGVYFYKLTADNFTDTKKMMLIK
jgi:hypothetical protein